jgi:HEAT repeat protein
MKLVRTLSVVAAVGWFASAAPAFQASVGIDREVIAAIQLNDAQKAAVNKLVEDHRSDLASEKAAVVMAARQALLDPLMTPQATIGTGFRLYLSSQLIDSLRPIVAGKADANAINALVIAGEIGTQPCVELLEAGVKATSPSVRRAAAYGMQRTFLALANHSPAMLQPIAE